MNKNKLSRVCILLFGLIFIVIQCSYASSCKVPVPKRKYLAALTINSFTLCDNSGCETQTEDGIISKDSQHNYYLRALSARNGTYNYYLLDRETFHEYQVPLTPGCGQFTFSLPISLKSGFADTDTVEMKCVGSVNKKGAVLGDCEGTFFSFELNGDFTIKGPFTLVATKQTVVNPCHTAAGILIYGSQCAGI